MNIIAQFLPSSGPRQFGVTHCEGLSLFDRVSGPRTGLPRAMMTSFELQTSMPEYYPPNVIPISSSSRYSTSASKSVPFLQLFSLRVTTGRRVSPSIIRHHDHREDTMCACQLNMMTWRLVVKVAAAWACLNPLSAQAIRVVSPSEGMVVVADR